MPILADRYGQVNSREPKEAASRGYIETLLGRDAVRPVEISVPEGKKQGLRILEGLKRDFQSPALKRKAFRHRSFKSRARNHRNQRASPWR